jgi:phosphoglycerol transferase MdoB-like AlkP superfamily enzyme
MPEIKTGMDKSASFRNKFHYLSRLLIYWMIVFTQFRLFFLVFNYQTIIYPDIGLAFKSLIAGLRLDLSMTAYLMMPSFLLWILQWFIRRPFINHVNNIYIFTVLFLLSILMISTIKMHHEWGTLLNAGIFNYLKHPGEMIAFISTVELLLWILFIGLHFGLNVFIYKKLVNRFPENFGKKILNGSILVLSLLLLPVMARGGFQLAPINESSAYFSEVSFFNHVAINPAWYFLHSLAGQRSAENPYLFMESEKAEMRNQNLFSKGDTAFYFILTTSRPNIVIIILESWTADIIQSLGGEANITPSFESLRKDGLLFTNIYGAGSRTEHGLISVLSGFPPPPHISIITMPSKTEKLNSLNEKLSADGYSSSFFYGGEIGFANMKSYLAGTHFKKIVDEASFEKNQLSPKWGAHDEYVFEKQVQYLNTEKEPFFSVILTLSSHEPFEVPMQTPFKGNDESDKFRKAAYYSDHALGEYFKAAKKENWYDNTLFILVADHGHRLPRNTDLNRYESKRIPLLFYGNVLKENVRGTTIPKTGNQHDIAATLLNQLHKDFSGFPKSKDLLNSGTKEFAYYTNDDVLGWVTPSDKFIYIYSSKELQNTGGPTIASPLNDSIVLDAKAFLQTHYAGYLGL